MASIRLQSSHSAMNLGRSRKDGIPSYPSYGDQPIYHLVMTFTVHHGKSTHV
jgi:hypothetical protein